MKTLKQIWSEHIKELFFEGHTPEQKKQLLNNCVIEWLQQRSDEVLILTQTNTKTGEMQHLGVPYSVALKEFLDELSGDTK